MCPGHDTERNGTERRTILTHHVLVGHSDPVQGVGHQRIRAVGVLDDQPEQIHHVLQRVAQPGQLRQLLGSPVGGRDYVQGRLRDEWISVECHWNIYLAVPHGRAECPALVLVSGRACGLVVG